LNKIYTSNNDILNISEEIASYVDSFDLNFVSKDVQSTSKTSVLDTLSVAVGGSKSHEGFIVKEVMSSYNGNPESSVINHDCKLPAPNAALINATMAHTLELDDIDR